MILKKASIADTIRDDGSRVYIFLGFESDQKDFRVIRGIRRGEDYHEKHLTVPTFLESADEDERASFFNFLSMTLSN